MQYFIEVYQNKLEHFFSCSQTNFVAIILLGLFCEVLGSLLCRSFLIAAVSFSTAIIEALSFLNSL